MPLDGRLPEPDLRTLAAILRDQSTWPPGFKWNYEDCETCAMGLAAKLYSQVEAPDTVAMAKAYKLSHDTVDDLFVGFHPLLYPIANERITPENVADAIDEYLMAGA